MERLPRRTPSAQMDVVGLVFDAIAGMVEDIPIIGDIVAFIASLFGRSSTANARLSRLEAVVSKGASGTDLFNRVDAGTLGTGPGMPGPWVQGGSGQALGVYGNAARLSPGGIPSAGRRWAKFPLVASTSAMAVEIGVDDRAISSDDMTTIIVCANSDFTEGIAANLFGVGVYLAPFTRSGTTWSFGPDFAADPSYKIERTQSVELRASGSGLYTLWIDNQRIIGGDLPSYPIDANHRWGGFAIRCSIPFPFVYRLGIGVAVFAMRSESEAFTAIETVETIANGAQTTATNAQTSAASSQAAVEQIRDVEVPRLDTRITVIENSVGGVSAKRSFFGNDGTWVRPEGGPWSRHVVDVIGGGSGGGRANLIAPDLNATKVQRAGVGGFSGGWNSAEFFDSDLPASVSVTIGPGGAGSTVDNTMGGVGGQTNFGGFLAAGGATTTAHGFGAKTIAIRGGSGGFTHDNGVGFTFPREATSGGGHGYGNGGIAAAPRGSGTRGGDGNAPTPSTLAYPGTGGGGGAEEGTVGDPGGNGGNGGYPGAPGGGGGQGGPFGGRNGNGGNAAAGACWVTSYK